MGDPLTLASLQNLEELLSPVYYDQEEPLPLVPPGAPVVPPGLTVQAFLSQDCMWGCSFNGPVLRCFPIKTHPHTDLLVGRNRVPVVINTTAYHFPSAIVNCAVEVSTHSQKSLAINKLLVGLDCGNQGGAVVIFDPIRAQPMKWICIPAAVTSLAVMSHFESESCIHPFFNESLMAMVGVAAVGLRGGKILMVDLGLDHIEGSSPEIVKNRRRSNSFSVDRSWHLLPVEPHEASIARKRKDAVLHRKCICLDLENQEFDESDEAYDPDLFFYLDKAGNTIEKYHKGHVFVSCLQYVPNIGSLIVGFNFGGLQIWRVDNRRLEHSIDNGTDETPVHSIEFQQPIDDPKNFCYLWVLYGSKSAELHNSHAILYALFYKIRNTSENNMLLYDDFQNCVPRLTFELKDFYAPDDAEEGQGSLPPSINAFVHPFRMWNQGENLTCFSWECNRDGVYYLGIFDLNQWYSSQTPNTLDVFGPRQLNPFWTAISFQNPIDIRRNVCGQMWDVRMIPGTSVRWENQFSKHEMHLYPSALTYQCVCLSSSGTYIFENFCIQEKLLRVIQKYGYQLMAEPSLLRSLCTRFGLDPVCSLGSGDKLSDQFYIFTMLLENLRPSLIIRMANRWVDGSMANLGCTIELILNWVYELTVAVRNLVDEHWVNLGKFHMDLLPPDTTYFISYSNFVWNQLVAILQTLVRHDRVCEDEYRDSEITKMEFILGKLVPYSSALLIMHKAGILPVNDNCDVIAELKGVCNERRKRVANALKVSPYLEPELRQGHTLLIDYLLENFDEEFLRDEWEVEPGEQLYPPKHPILIFNMLIGSWVDIDRKIISRVIFYFILDIMHLKGHETILRGDFASIIQLTPTEQQEVVQIWNVDHGEFQDPLALLAQIGKIDETTGLPWSAAIVHTVIQGSGSEPTVMEILRRSCPPKLGKLFLNLVSRSHQPYGADKFMQIVSSSGFCRNEELLFHCFENASSLGFIEGFIRVHSRHTPISVQQALISYLDKPPITYANQHLLLTFFLCRKDHSRATEQFERMKRQWPDRRNFTAQETKSWRVSEAEIKTIVDGSTKNHIMDFLGYAPQKSIPKPPTLEIRGQKYIPTTPPSKVPLPLTMGKPVLPAIQRILGAHMRDGATPLSPLRRYSGRIEIPEIENEPEQPSANGIGIGNLESRASPGSVSRASQSPLRTPHRMSLNNILKSPRIDHRAPVAGLKEWDDDEHNDSFKTCFGSPCVTPAGPSKVGGQAAELHSIMKKREAELDSSALKKRVLLRTRFEDLDPDEGSPGPESKASTSLDDGDDDVESVPSSSVQSGETIEKSRPKELEIEIQNISANISSDEDEVEIEVDPMPTSVLQPSEIVEDFQSAVFQFVNNSPSLEEIEDEAMDVPPAVAETVPQAANPPQVEGITASELFKETMDESGPPPPGDQIINTEASLATAEVEAAIPAIPDQFDFEETLDESGPTAEADPIENKSPEETGKEPDTEAEPNALFAQAGEPVESGLESGPSTSRSQNLNDARMLSSEISPESDGDSQLSGDITAPQTMRQMSNLINASLNEDKEEVEVEVDPIPSGERGLSVDEINNMNDARKREVSVESDVDSRHSGDITAPSTMKRMTRSLSRAKSVETDQSMDVDSDNSSVGVGTSSGAKGKTKRKVASASTRKRRKGAATTTSITDLVATTTSKLQAGQARRGMTPEIGSHENADEITEIIPPRRVTRSLSRARSEVSDGETSFLDRSDSEASVLDSSIESTSQSQRKKRRRVKSTNESLNATYDGPSSRTRTKCKSEPRDLNLSVSVVDADTSGDTSISPVNLDSEVVARRAIFGFAPALSTVIEDSESSQAQTPVSSILNKSRVRRGSSTQRTLLKEPSPSTSSPSLQNIPEELPLPESPKPGPSRKAGESHESSFEIEIGQTQPGKRRRCRSAQPLGGPSDAEFPEIEVKRRKSDLRKEKEEDADSDASTQSQSTGRPVPVAKRGRGRPKKRAQSETK